MGEFLWMMEELMEVDVEGGGTWWKRNIEEEEWRIEWWRKAAENWAQVVTSWNPVVPAISIHFSVFIVGEYLEEERRSFTGIIIEAKRSVFHC